MTDMRAKSLNTRVDLSKIPFPTPIDLSLYSPDSIVLPKIPFIDSSKYETINEQIQSIYRCALESYTGLADIHEDHLKRYKNDIVEDYLPMQKSISKNDIESFIEKLETFFTKFFDVYDPDYKDISERIRLLEEKSQKTSEPIEELLKEKLRLSERIKNTEAYGVKYLSGLSEWLNSVIIGNAETSDIDVLNDLKIILGEDTNFYRFVSSEDRIKFNSILKKYRSHKFTLDHIAKEAEKIHNGILNCYDEDIGIFYPTGSYYDIFENINGDHFHGLCLISAILDVKDSERSRAVEDAIRFITKRKDIPEDYKLNFEKMLKALIN